MHACENISHAYKIKVTSGGWNFVCVFKGFKVFLCAGGGEGVEYVLHVADQIFTTPTQVLNNHSLSGH